MKPRPADTDGDVRDVRAGVLLTPLSTSNVPSIATKAALSINRPKTAACAHCNFAAIGKLGCEFEVTIEAARAVGNTISATCVHDTEAGSWKRRLFVSPLCLGAAAIKPMDCALQLAARVWSVKGPKSASPYCGFGFSLGGCFASVFSVIDGLGNDCNRSDAEDGFRKVVAIRSRWSHCRRSQR